MKELDGRSELGKAFLTTSDPPSSFNNSLLQGKNFKHFDSPLHAIEVKIPETVGSTLSVPINAIRDNIRIQGVPNDGQGKDRILCNRSCGAVFHLAGFEDHVFHN